MQLTVRSARRASICAAIGAFFGALVIAMLFSAADSSAAMDKLFDAHRVRRRRVAAVRIACGMVRHRGDSKPQSFSLVVMSLHLR